MASRTRIVVPARRRDAKNSRRRNLIAEPPPEAPVSFNIVFVAPPNRDPEPDLPGVRFVPPGPR